MVLGPAPMPGAYYPKTAHLSPVRSGTLDRVYARSWIWTSEKTPSRTFVNKGKKKGRGVGGPGVSSVAWVS
jgi:hypothetical protein